MAVEVKFCGLTRPADAALGARLGARYLGVILTESPRRVTAEQATALFSAAEEEGSPRRVGVFGGEPPEDVARHAQAIGLQIVQLHADPTAEQVRAVRSRFGGEIWAARRLRGAAVPDDISEIASVADRVLFDARPSRGSTLGGSGESFDWEALAAALNGLTPAIDFVLAGGLRPANVVRAVELLQPSVVDVSSGVEEQPGIKDPRLMKAFVYALAVRAP